ncbi:HutD/Ves family protein [Rahnella sikkimica]|uniref:HutD family protein n=1 Tax=Rahnella sikkimica TaxID=1805933 RepID=A0A2L1UNP5_9GAMM|nr:HutD family protein [Rahnella sikkimica]AVF34556.1 HutD family protein [Rahnella sikkimica]
MTNWQHFSFDSLPVSPWRNGGGETREILSWPPGKTDFDWRASIATIAQDGPFSAFPGIDRSITLLSGGGVHLLAEPEIDHHLSEAGKPFAFSGDIALNATLTGGTTTDFNIMTRRNGCSAQVISTAKSLCVSLNDGGVLYAIRGTWQWPDGCQFGGGEGFFHAALADANHDGESVEITAISDNGLLLWAKITR